MSERIAAFWSRVLVSFGLPFLISRRCSKMPILMELWPLQWRQPPLSHAHMNAAVTINHEMITYAAHSALPVPAVNIRYGEVATFLGRTAMNDDFLYLTHDIEY